MLVVRSPMRQKTSLPGGSDERPDASGDHAWPVQSAASKWASSDPHNLLASQPKTSHQSSQMHYPSSTYFRLLGRGLRASNPTFSPFSEINSMPASSNASRILFAASSETCRRSFSKSTTVDRPIAALSASCDWVMSNNARAARHCAGVIIPTISVDHVDGGTYKQFMLIN
jgi:hypothetical protein